MNPIDTLREKLAGISRDVEALQASVAAGGRVEMTTEELEKMNGLSSQYDGVRQQIEAYERAQAMQSGAAAPQPRVTATAASALGATTATAPPQNGASTFTGGTLVSANFGNHGFTRGAQEWLSSVKMASYGKTDPRLLNAVTTYGSEGIGPDGGFAMPPDFAATITSIVTGEDSLVSKFNPITTASNQVTLPTDETTPYGTAGIYGEWLGEAGTMTPRKASLKQVTVNLYKVGVLAHLSDELVADAPAVQSHVTRKIAAAIAAKVNEALVSGDGIAKPLGLLNAPGAVTQVKSTTVLAAVDLANMLSRMVPESVNSSFWLVHSSALPKIWTLVLGQMPIYAQDFRQSPYGALLGRPIFISEFCSDYNTVGDIFLVSPDGYALAVKSGGVTSAASIHFAFDQGLQSFRATMRIGGTPLASGAIARKNGSTTLSHIINMGVRS
jgi:HK97 family phage major capsid protein